MSDSQGGGRYGAVSCDQPGAIRTSSPHLADKRVAVVGTAGIPARYGGFETLAACLCERFEGAGPRLAVYCCKGLYPERLGTYHGAELRYVRLRANGWQSVIYDAVSIVDGLFRGADVILLLGVSGALCVPLVRLLSSARVVTNVDGVESRREKWGPIARGILRTLEWCAVKYSHEVIADNAGIQEYVREKYGTLATVIAYGGDHAAPRGDEPRPPVAGRYALAIARIEPENNIELMLSAWAAPRVVEQMALVVIGNWDGSEYGRQLRNRFSGRPGYFLLDPIYERDRVRSFRAHASAYVHGHSAGGTNPSLVEAMFFDVPIIAYECIFNRHTLGNRGRYFGNVDGLREAMCKQRDAEDDGDVQAVTALAAERYTWDRIAAAYAEALARSQ